MKLTLIPCITFLVLFSSCEKYLPETSNDNTSKLPPQIEEFSSSSNSITKGLVAFYPFNGNAKDESGFLNHGNTFNVTLTSDRFSKANKAYSFDGSSSYIQVPNHVKNNFTGDFTLCVWVNANPGYGSASPWGNHNHIVSKWGNGGPGKASYSIGVTTGGYALSYVHDGVNTLGFVSTNFIPTGSWHFLVSRYSLGNLTIFYDGKPIQTITNVVKPQNSNFPLDFGREGETNQAHFNGKIDDIRLYDRALNDAEILSIFKLTK